MTTIIFSPEPTLTSLTRIVQPQHAVSVVNLGTIFGIELDGDSVTITVAHTPGSESIRVEVEQMISDMISDAGRKKLGWQQQ